jgi:zinc protease
MYRAIAVSVALLAASACGSVIKPKPPEPARSLSINTKIHTFALRNGMRVLVLEDNATDLVYVGARYDVGAIVDPDGKHGLAHVAEHVAFLTSFGGKRLDTRQAEAALASNAATTWDYTHFYAIGRETELEQLLEVEAARLQPGLCQTVNQEDFAREREIILNELRYRYGDGGDKLLGQILATAYPEGHPYRRLVGGDEPQVASISKDDVCGFIDRYYVPAHVTVVISGNVDRDRATEVVNATLGQIPGRAPVDRPRPPSPPVAKANKTVQLPVDQPVLYTMWRLPMMMSDERTAAEMAMEMIAMKLRGWNADNQFATAISFSITGGEHAPVAVLSIYLSGKGKAGEARDWIGKAVKRFDEGSDEDDFVATRQYALTGLVRRLDSLGGRADRFADYIQLVDGTRGYFVDELARVDQLRRNQVRLIGQDVFATGGAASLLVVPDPSADETYTPVEVTYAGSGHASNDRKIEVDPAVAEQPLEVPVSKSRLHEARLFTLDNGMRVAMLPSSSVPIVDIRLIFGGGTSTEPTNQAGLAAAAARLLRPNLDTVTAREQVDALLRFYKVGGSVNASASDDATVFRVVGLEGYYDILLRGLERSVKAGSYWRDAVDGYKRAMSRLLDTRARASQVASSRALYRAVYGAGHPYADRGFITSQSIRKINLDALQDYRKKHFVASNAVLVVTGKFDPDLMEKHIRYNFEDWGSGSVASPADQPAARSGSNFKVASDDQPTVTINVAWPVDNVWQGAAAWLVLEQMLSARVAEVRQSMGASYGMSASLRIRRGPSMLVVSGDVDRRRAGDALKAVLAAIDELRAGGGSFAADFALARRGLAAQYASATNSAASTASELSTALVHGLGTRYASTLVDAIARLKPADVKALLDRELRPNRRSIVLHGPKAAVDRAMTAAGVTNASWFE